MFRPLPRDWAEVREYDTKCQRATFRCVFASMFTQPGPSWTELGPTHLAEDSSNIHKAPSCATFYLFSDLISFSSSFFRGVSKWESDEIKENLSKSVTICRPDLGQNTWMRQKRVSTEYIGIYLTPVFARFALGGFMCRWSAR